jgi:hypothetical protein
MCPISIILLLLFSFIIAGSDLFSSQLAILLPVNDYQEINLYLANCRFRPVHLPVNDCHELNLNLAFGRFRPFHLPVDDCQSKNRHWRYNDFSLSV